jgi:hypothetical protein
MTREKQRAPTELGGVTTTRNMKRSDSRRRRSYGFLRICTA